MTHHLFKSMRAIFAQSFIIFALFTPLHFASAQDYDFSNAISILEGYVKEDKLAGSVMIVTKDGKPILHYATGMQNREAGIPMQKNSLFRIASQSKALTSVAILILQERGLLKVSDPVSKYISGFKNTKVSVEKDDKSTTIVPAKREITIHDLLTHTSGISYGMGKNKDLWDKAVLSGWYHADKDKNIVETLAPITTIPFEAQPGEKFVYGHSTDILGAVIEVVTKKSLADFIHQEITQPLGMKDTFFFVPNDKVNRLAAVYNATETTVKRAPSPSEVKDRLGLMSSQGHYVKGPRKAFAGGAGLISTAQDYATFLNMLLSDGTLKGVKIISPNSVAMMTQDQIPYVKMEWNNGFGYGFALTKGKEGPTKDKVVQYEWGGAYHSSYYVRPLEGITVVYLTQLIPTKGLKDWAEINKAIRTELGID